MEMFEKFKNYFVNKKMNEQDKKVIPSINYELYETQAEEWIYKHGADASMNPETSGAVSINTKMLNISAYEFDDKSVVSLETIDNSDRIIFKAQHNKELLDIEHLKGDDLKNYLAIEKEDRKGYLSYKEILNKVMIQSKTNYKNFYSDLSFENEIEEIGDNNASIDRGNKEYILNDFKKKTEDHSLSINDMNNKAILNSVEKKLIERGYSGNELTDIINITKSHLTEMPIIKSVENEQEFER